MTSTRREVRKTALYYCEGGHEYAFASLLVRYYGSGRSLAITKKIAGGGSLVTISQKASRQSKDFDKTMIKADGDRGEADPSELSVARQICRDNNVTLLLTNPCLDALLMQILDPSFTSGQHSSREIKAMFEANYIPSRHRRDVSKYERMFSKQVLDEARIRIPELNRFISFFEN